MCVCAEVRSFPTHTGDLTTRGNAASGVVWGDRPLVLPVPGSSALPGLAFLHPPLLSVAGGGTPMRCPWSPPGDQAGSHHHTGVSSPLWAEGYRMGIPGDLGKEGPHPCSLIWGPQPWPSQNPQTVGAPCMRLSCGFPCPQHHQGAPGGLMAGQSWVPPPLPVGHALTSLCSCLCSHETPALLGAGATPGGSAFPRLGCTVSAEQGCAFIGSSSCY